MTSGLCRAPLRGDDDLNPLMERIGDARYVLLGEASHGTSEYYTWRNRISRRLIQEKGFSFIAVEGDWPDCCRVNRFVKGTPDSRTSADVVLHAFDRWPTWMWANEVSRRDRSAAPASSGTPGGAGAAGDLPQRGVRQRGGDKLSFGWFRK